MTVGIVFKSLHRISASSQYNECRRLSAILKDNPKAEQAKATQNNPTQTKPSAPISSSTVGGSLSATRQQTQAIRFILQLSWLCYQMMLIITLV